MHTFFGRKSNAHSMSTKHVSVFFSVLDEIVSAIPTQANTHHANCSKPLNGRDSQDTAKT